MTMNANSRQIIQNHWTFANGRDWTQFATLLDPALQYEMPQTREYIETAEGYVDMFRTWSGKWTAIVKLLVCEDDRGVSIIDFVVGAETMTGITAFEIASGKIIKVTDYWPEPYEPPARQSSYMRRRQ